MPQSVCIGLGSNLGDKQRNLGEALGRIAGFARVRAVSSLYRTAPVGFLQQDWFLNAAAVLDTGMAPASFLESLLAVERAMGRVRGIRNGPRLIDLDLLLWGGDTVNLPGLEIPHPRLAERHFVLLPLAEIAGDWVHPLHHLAISQLAEDLGPADGVERLSSRDWPPEELGVSLS